MFAEEEVARSLALSPGRGRASRLDRSCVLLLFLRPHPHLPGPGRTIRHLRGRLPLASLPPVVLILQAPPRPAPCPARPHRAVSLLNDRSALAPPPGALQCVLWSSQDPPRPVSGVTSHYAQS